MNRLRKINGYTPTEREHERAARALSLYKAGDLDAVVNMLAAYREELIRPLVGRATAPSADPRFDSDPGTRDVLVMSRGDAFDIINRARGRST